MFFRNKFISLKVLHYLVVLFHVSVVLGSGFHTVDQDAQTQVTMSLSSSDGHTETRKRVRH